MPEKAKKSPAPVAVKPAAAPEVDPVVKVVLGIIAEELCMDDADIHLDATIIALGGDDLDQADILMQIEDYFKVEFHDDEKEIDVMESYSTPRSILNFLAQVERERQQVMIA